MRIENEEHGKDGTRFHESSSYEGRVFVCLCGERFVDAGDLDKHIGECLPSKSLDRIDAILNLPEST